ncbi:hypothetical protein GOP47_0015457 [Adiantum capillus-veneris]|uniref:Protein kinase domain-containing protein n=1 Tax=Adiantum capillus-veneris TaxID=13818 RepID=A0A9D4UJR3_ADICA|nr:hypothetical protein GOP47_0015457 [Adiantum capillus-veneris]
MADSSLALIDHTYRLLYFSSKGDVTALKRTLEEGATPDAADYDNRTALHLAASEGHRSVVELLLQYKASVNPVDRWNRTPLADARRYGFSEICEVLVACGGVEEVERLGYNPEQDSFNRKIGLALKNESAQRQTDARVDYTYQLLYCASKGDLLGLNKVLRQGASPDSADYDKRTALHLASSEGHIKVVELLLNYNASVNPKDRWGRTPLSDATKYGFRDICRLLEANGAMLGDDASIPIEDCELDPKELLEDKDAMVEQGSFGEIRTVIWRGTKVAVKKIKASLNANPQIRKEFQKELSIWKHLRHPNIVQFLGAVTRGDQLAIVTEYLQKGDLDKLMMRGPLDADTAIMFALDIARGMNYLHEHKPVNLVHRDLTPKNLLLDDAGHLKVADFGLSKLLEASSKNIFESYNMTGVTGSFRYMAPEVFRGEQYNKSVDVFSFAIIVAEMFQGRDSLSSESDHLVAGKRAHENIRPLLTAMTYPDGLKELLNLCWDDVPMKRPTFAEIIPCLEEIQRKMNKPKKKHPCLCTCM